MPITNTSEKARITRATVDAAWRRRAAGCRHVLRDTDVRGLSLVVTANAAVWVYSFKPRGLDAKGKRWPSRTLTIGNTGSHSPETARQMALQARATVSAGGDPAAEKRAARRVVEAARASSVALLLEAYAEALPSRPSLRGTGRPSAGHVSNELQHLRAAVTAAGMDHLSAVEIAPEHVARAIGAKAGQATRFHRFGALRRFLDWLLEHGDITATPA